MEKCLKNFKKKPAENSRYECHIIVLFYNIFLLPILFHKINPKR